MNPRIGLFSLALAALAALAACSGGEGDPDGGSAKDGGGADGGAGGAFALTVLDPAAPGELPIALAARGDKLGVAYFIDTGGSPCCELRYVEPGGQPEVVATVDRVFGASVAFDAQGAPYVAYLGGDSENSVFWLQSDLALASRTGGTWTSEVVVRTSGEAASGVGPSDSGRVVGLWPALAIDATGAMHLAYRDVHGGQFATDWQHADLEIADGRPGSWTLSVAALGGNVLDGHGGMNAIALSGDAPGLAWSAQAGSATDTPRDVWFARRKGTSWSAPDRIARSADTGSGPSLAFSEKAGFAIAFEDRAAGVLSYMESADGAGWSTPEPLHGSGTGGWFPSLAFAPDGEPAIAYYVCSQTPAAVTCRDDDDALVLKVRRAGMWPAKAATVDPGGASWPRLAYAGGKAAIAYRSRSGQLKLAREP